MFHVPAHKAAPSQPQAGQIVNPVEPQHQVKAPSADFAFRDHGSICVLTPVSEAGLRWVRENLPADVLLWAGGIVVEPRYVGDILDGIEADALEVV